MRNPLLSLLILTSLAACVPGENPTDRTAGFKAGERLMIRLTNTSVEFDGCTDASEWTSQAHDLANQLSPAFVAYEISSDATEADLLRCSSPSNIVTCSVRDPRVVLAIEEGALVNSFVERSVPSGSSCTVVFSTTARTEDHGTTFVEIAEQTISLEGNSADCASLDEHFAELSTNGLGIDGCLITYTTNGALH